MEIKVLGTGCAKCKTTYQTIEKVISENNLDVTLTKVEDIVEILNSGIMATPAVAVNGVVKIKGHVPSEKYGYKNYNHPKEDFQLFFSIHNYILNTE